MIPLKSHQRVWSWLCVYSTEEHINKRNKIARIVFTLLVLVAHVSLVVASFVFIIKFVSSDFKGSLHALFPLIALASTTYTVVYGVNSRQKIVDIFEILETIHYESKN